MYKSEYKKINKQAILSKYYAKKCTFILFLVGGVPWVFFNVKKSAICSKKVKKKKKTLL